MLAKIRRWVVKTYLSFEYTSFWLFLCINLKIHTDMRTNVVIDDNLMAKAMKFSGLKTKKQVIEAALKEFIYTNALQKLEEMRGEGVWEGNLAEMRTSLSE